MTSKYLAFIEDTIWLMSHKTKRFIVRSKHQECILGIIKYNPKWRQYCFYPDIQYETMWSIGCLQDIIKFMEVL